MLGREEGVAGQQDGRDLGSHIKKRIKYMWFAWECTAHWQMNEGGDEGERRQPVRASHHSGCLGYNSMGRLLEIM